MGKVYSSVSSLSGLSMLTPPFAFPVFGGLDLFGFGDFEARLGSVLGLSGDPSVLPLRVRMTSSYPELPGGVFGL